MGNCNSEALVYKTEENIFDENDTKKLPTSTLKTQQVSPVETARCFPGVSKEKKTHILIIGAGVIGLTSAYKLSGAGFKVTVVASEYAPRPGTVGGYTSVVAGALWEYPPGVCGRHHDEKSLERSKRWSLESYNRYLDDWKDKIPGVFMLKTNFYFRFNLDEDELELEKMNALRDNTLGFRRGLEEHKVCDGIEVNLDDEIKDAYSWLSPHIDTNAYMDWLTRLLEGRKNVTLVKKTIEGVPLIGQEKKLKEEYNAQFIVNCTGLGCMKLVPDEDMHALRGGVIRVVNDGKHVKKFNESFVIQRGPEDKGNQFIFIVPRGEDRLLIGGITEPHEYDINVGMGYEPYQQMYESNCKLIPVLRDAKIDEREPVRVGLRPYTTRNVQLYRQEGTDIIHCYGHGGAGFCLAWGCAEEIMQTLKREFQRKKIPMKGEASQ